MKLIYKSKIHKIYEWLMYMIGYSVILITLSFLFKKTIYIDNNLFGLWALLASIIIYILNKTIKPIIVRVTIPITGLTFGIFYPFVNVIILQIVDFILGKHFYITGIFMSFIIACLISILNILMDDYIINPLIRKG